MGYILREKKIEPKFVKEVLRKSQGNRLDPEFQKMCSLKNDQEF